MSGFDSTATNPCPEGRESIAFAETQPQAPWMKYAGIVATGNPKSSYTVNEVIYGRRRPTANRRPAAKKKIRLPLIPKERTGLIQSLTGAEIDEMFAREDAGMVDCFGKPIPPKQPVKPRGSE